MCCKNFWKTILPFILTFSISLCIANLYENINLETDTQNKNLKNVEKIVFLKETGSGFGCRSTSSNELICFACKDGKYKSISELETKHNIISKIGKIQVLSKPRPNYTVEARLNSIQGKVQLRTTFLANGNVGNIAPIKELPDGLTEQAIEAAQKIKFKPATRNGIPILVTKIVEYNFTLY